MSRRLFAALAIVSVAAVLLAGCVGIPRSGTVFIGEEVSQQELGGIEYIVDGPSPGETQEQILRGFINAFKASGDYNVAREFLSSDFVDDWEPRESVLVHTGQVRFVTAGEDTMQYVISPNAAVDASGTYTPSTPTPATLQYSFVEEDGEWRISAAPNGIVLSEGTFNTVFGQHVLYFLDPSGSSLVPDLRWFPAGTAATRIVSALLAGPPAWLQGAVTTSFPAGTQLTSPKRVGVEETTAVVDLTPEALSSTTGQRQIMRLQLETSLGLVPSISNVSISVNGAELEIAEPGAGLPQVHPRVDNRSLVLANGEFGFYSNGQLAPIEALSDKVVALAPTAASLAENGSSAAVLGPAGVSIVRSSQDDPLLLDARPGLIPPSLDRYGFVWSVPAGNPRGLRAFDAAGNPFDIATTIPPDSTVVSIDVSRDGARLAMLLMTPEGPRLLVGAILRDANAALAPLSLGEPIIDTVLSTADAIDSTWLDQTTVATLTSDGTEQADVTAFKVGGMRSALGSPGAAVGIVGGNGESGLRALRADGVVSALRSASGWQATQAEVELLANQG